MAKSTPSPTLDGGGLPAVSGGTSDGQEEAKTEMGLGSQETVTAASAGVAQG